MKHYIAWCLDCKVWFIGYWHFHKTGHAHIPLENLFRSVGAFPE